MAARSSTARSADAPKPADGNRPGSATPPDIATPPGIANQPSIANDPGVATPAHIANVPITAAAVSTAAYPGHARFLPYLLNRVTSRLNVDFQLELHRRGMTLTHWRVLAFLSERDGLPVTGLASMIAADQSTVSRALLRLEHERCIERQPAAADNRVVEVFITDTGRALFHDILPTALRLHEAAVRGIGPRELAALSKTLTRILANLG